MVILLIVLELTRKGCRFAGDLCTDRRPLRTTAALRAPTVPCTACPTAACARPCRDYSPSRACCGASSGIRAQHVPPLLRPQQWHETVFRTHTAAGRDRAG